MILGPFQFQVDDFDLIPPWVEPTGKDFEAQILFATETVTAPLNPKIFLLSTPSTNPKTTLLSVGEHLGKFLVRLQALPLKGDTPVLEGATSLTFSLVVAELPEPLLEEVGRVRQLVGIDQHLQVPTAIRSKILQTREQCILRTLDETSALTRQAGGLSLTPGIQRLA